MYPTLYRMPKSPITLFRRLSDRKPKMVLASLSSRRPRGTTAAAPKARRKYKAYKAASRTIWTLFLILPKRSNLPLCKIAKVNNILSNAQEAHLSRRTSSQSQPKRARRTAIRWTISIWWILSAKEIRVKLWARFLRNSWMRISRPSLIWIRWCSTCQDCHRTKREGPRRWEWASKTPAKCLETRIAQSRAKNSRSRTLNRRRRKIVITSRLKASWPLLWRVSNPSRTAQTLKTSRT